MGTVTTLPQSRPLTRADLDAMPDDGHRYELIDGSLIVTPTPGHLHQRAVLELAIRLRSGCPADVEVLIAPFDVALAEDTIMQPDVLVARRRDITRRDLPVAPVLAVEVLSPSTRRIDMALKRSRLEAAGCAHYWVVDPLEPAIMAWRLEGGAYVQGGRATGDECFAVRHPYPLELTPAELVAG
jgi:Uma2 family endonuclease